MLSGKISELCYKRIDRRRETDVKHDKSGVVRQIVDLILRGVLAAVSLSGQVGLCVLWAIAKWLIVLIAAVVVLVKDIRWNRSSLMPGSKSEPLMPILITMWPMAWMIMTHAIMLTAQVIGVRLKRYGFQREERVTYLAHPMARNREPPDKPFIATKSRPASANTSKRLLLLGLQAAATIASQMPTVRTERTQVNRQRLRRYRGKNGWLLTGKLSENDTAMLQAAVSDISYGLLTKDDCYPLIVDSGCTCSCTGFETDFEAGSLRPLERPTTLGGIAGGLEAKQRGTIRYEVLTDQGNVATIRAEALLVPNLSTRLLSPQDYLWQLHTTGEDTKASFTTRALEAKLTWGSGETLTIEYDENTFLPVVRAYSSATQTAEALALRGCVTEEVNQNLTPGQKLLLRFHYKLGHLAFAAVQWLGRQGWLGPKGEKMGHQNLQAPKCAACQFGKQGKTPTPGRHVTFDASGKLKTDKLDPGQLIFSDQYTSRVPGRAFTSKGKSSSDLQYTGGTIFCDAASGFVFAMHQVGLTAEETIRSKIAFEREAVGCGVSVLNYHTDNGIYARTEYMRELAQKGQGIKMSGVSAQFQNGVAENAIKIVTQKSRTMMIHAALRWPGMVEKELWPMALSHAVYLYNHTPSQATGLSPLEVFARTKSEHHALLHAHPWGCPAYVLEPQLREGQKIPKWDPRSRRGQYMGASPMHASTVGLVRNLQTGRISPHFHLVYDDFFETVHADASAEPDEWPELLMWSTFRSYFEDDPDYSPELEDEWLNPAEINAKRQREAQRRANRQAIAIDHNNGINTNHEVQQRDQREEEVMVVQQEPVVEADVEFPQENEPDVFDDGPPAPQSPMAVPPIEGPRRSTRSTQGQWQSHRHGYDGAQGSGYKAVVDLCGRLAKGLFVQRRPELDYRYLFALLTCPDSGLLDGMHPMMGQFPSAFKASKTRDPDTPNFGEAMAGPYKDEYIKAMETEVGELEEHNTWTVVPLSSIPEGANILPSTWAFKHKRYPNGESRKFKARFCARGDRQIEGVDYFEKYAPVAQWSTV